MKPFPILFGLVLAGAVLLIPAVSFASEAAFSKYYRDRSDPSDFRGNLNCPSGWTQIDSWRIHEGDKNDGGGGWHNGKACASNSYQAAFSKYYRTNNPDIIPSCPGGWNKIDSWAVHEGDKNDGHGGWHSGVACATNNYQSAIDKYFRERAGGNPAAAWTGNADGCPAGPWTKIDSWRIHEGDSSDGGGGWHIGFACGYAGSQYTKTFPKYYRTGHSAIIPPCPGGWDQIDSWSVWEGDPDDGFGGVHSGVVCAAPNPVGTIQGFKVKMPGNDSGAVPPGQETVSLDGGSPTTANPYFFRDVSSGNRTVSVSVPAGWSIGYTLCYNSTGCHGNTPTPGNSVTVNVPSGGYADLWWHYSISTGTIKIKATKDGQPWDSPPLVVDVTTPVGRMNVTADPPDEMRDVPAGTYAVHNVTVPSGAGVTLVDFLPGTAMQNLPGGGTITFTFNFATTPSSTGTVKIKATKDGSPWDSPPFRVNSSIPGSTGDIEIDPAIPSQDIAGAPAGMYTSNSIPPNQQALAGVVFQNVNGSSLPYGQNLSGGGTITFIFNFTTTVQPPAPTLVVSPTSASIGIGGTRQFNAIYDPDGSGVQSPQTVTSSASWSSSNTFIASISGGLATGNSAGSATITATYSGLSNSAALNVASLQPTLTITPSSSGVQIGGAQQFNAIYDPDGSGAQSEQNVTTSANWSSSNTPIATVNSSGLARGESVGNANIRANYSGLSNSAPLTVNIPSLSVSCSASPASATTGQPVAWTAAVSGGTAPYNYSWSGSSPLGGQTGNPVTVTYTTIGAKTGSVSVTSGSQTVSQSCGASVGVTAPPQPDLVSENLQISIPSPMLGQSIIFSGNVKNQGASAGTVPTNARFRLDLGNDGSYDLTLGAPPIPALASGASSPAFASSAWTTAAGTHRIQLCADYLNAQNDEASEANNCVSQAVTVASTVPDLTIAPSSIGINSGNLIPGSAVTFKATVQNAGSAAAGGTFSSRFEIDLNNSVFAAADVILTPNPALTALAAGTNAAITSGNWFAAAGTHTLRVCADQPNPSVYETNETNNCASIRLTSSGTPDWCEIPTDAPPDYECPP